MTSNPKSAPNSLQVAPGVLLLFVASLLICLGTVFVSQWTTSGPTFVPTQSVNPVILDRALPGFLRLPDAPEMIALPMLMTMMLCLGLRWLPLNNWTRLGIKLLVPVLMGRYLLWRITATLNFHHWMSGVFSVLFLLIELTGLLTIVIYTIQTIWSTDELRQRQANHYEQRVRAGEYAPTVDVLIPTYNEPEYIVRRTVIGAQAMHYANKTIYILDDTRREHIRALAQELGCEYITRPDNAHAKAGNLNHALQQTQGELIALMDADFVPFRNFLDRTVGFFCDPQNTLVQTPQDFYNPDYHARNLGLVGVMPNDLEHFYGSLQSHRDATNSTICCGSCYVVRRSAIAAIGGYFTKCCVEDYQTSLKLLLNGAKIVYLNEILSRGESTRTYADFLDQRLRWLQGNYQVYFCGKNLPIGKLGFAQKTFLFNQFIFCFQAFIRLVYLLAPTLALYVGVSPCIAPLTEVLYYFVPFWLLLIGIHGWASGYRTSQFWSEVYEVAFCFPAVNRLTKIIFNPFRRVSKVTRKGVKAAAKNYNLAETWPLILLLNVNLVGLGVHYYGINAGWWNFPSWNVAPQYFWVGYNSLLVFVAILSSIDQPIRRSLDRFPLQAHCELRFPASTCRGLTLDLSEQGALMQLDHRVDVADVPEQFPLRLIDDQRRSYWVTARVVARRSRQHQVRLDFVDVPLVTQRYLIERLYCDLHDWKARRPIGGLDGMLSLLSVTLQLRPILRRYED
jgi:cellulose synthase (UDP-forming)